MSVSVTAKTYRKVSHLKNLLLVCLEQGSVAWQPLTKDVPAKILISLYYNTDLVRGSEKYLVLAQNT